MLPLYDMKGKLPVKLLYTTPGCLLVNTPKQKTLAMVSLQSSRMTFGACAQGALAFYGKSTICGIIGMPGTSRMSGIGTSHTTCAGTLLLGIVL
jgi:hypothetical protein